MVTVLVNGRYEGGAERVLDKSIAIEIDPDCTLRDVWRAACAASDELAQPSIMVAERIEVFDSSRAPPTKYRMRHRVRDVGSARAIVVYKLQRRRRDADTGAATSVDNADANQRRAGGRRRSRTPVTSTSASQHSAEQKPTEPKSILRKPHRDQPHPLDTPIPSHAGYDMYGMPDAHGAQMLPPHLHGSADAAYKTHPRGAYTSSRRMSGEMRRMSGEMRRMSGEMQRMSGEYPVDRRFLSLGKQRSVAPMWQAPRFPSSFAPQRVGPSAAGYRAPRGRFVRSRSQASLGGAFGRFGFQQWA